MLFSIANRDCHFLRYKAYAGFKLGRIFFSHLCVNGKNVLICGPASAFATNRLVECLSETWCLVDKCNSCSASCGQLVWPCEVLMYSIVIHNKDTYFITQRMYNS